MRLIAFTIILSCGLSAAPAGETDAVAAAVRKSLPLLQKVGPTFWYGAGCISCHNNTLPDVAVTIARERGFKVDEEARRAATKMDADILETRTERLLEALAPGGGQNTMGSLLYSLSVQNYPRDEAMEAGARYLKIIQSADGSWPILNAPSAAGCQHTMTLTALLHQRPAGLRAAFAETAIRRKHTQSGRLDRALRTSRE